MQIVFVRPSYFGFFCSVDDKGEWCRGLAVSLHGTYVQSCPGPFFVLTFVAPSRGRSWMTNGCGDENEIFKKTDEMLANATAKRALAHVCWGEDEACLVWKEWETSSLICGRIFGVLWSWDRKLLSVALPTEASENMWWDLCVTVDSFWKS